MSKAISAADANREFSAVLRAVREGHSYVVTAHGRPVARIVPVTAADHVTITGRDLLLRRLKSAPVRARAVRRWTRADLYDDAR